MKKSFLKYIPLCMMLVMASCGETLNDEYEYEAIKSEISVNEASLSFPGDEQSLTVHITCNSYWVAETNSSWLYFDKNSGKGNGSLSVHASANPSTTSERSDKITITDGIKVLTISVTQAPVPEKLSLSESSLKFSYGNESAYVYVESNVNWTATSDADWCTLKTTSYSITVSVQANNTYSSRSATITVNGLSSSASPVIKVSQSAPKEPTLSDVTISDITKTSANCKFSYSSEDLSIQTCGFCYSSISVNPTVDDIIQYKSPYNYSGTTSISLTGLTLNTTYYVRPYVRTVAGITYGQTVQFTTDKIHSPGEGDNPTPGY